MPPLLMIPWSGVGRLTAEHVKHGIQDEQGLLDERAYTHTHLQTDISRACTHAAPSDLHAVAVDTGLVSERDESVQTPIEGKQESERKVSTRALAHLIISS